MLERVIGPIAHQTAGRSKAAIRTDRGNRVAALARADEVIE
jgi:hypothetical protein